MKIFYLYLSFFLFFFGQYDGQSQEYKLSVRVVNGTTNQPLENGNIFIVPCSCGGVSDSNGSFSINLPKGDYKISFTYIGFEENLQNIVLNKDSFLEVTLNENEEKLSEVIVRAKKVNTSLETPQMGVLRLESKDLAKIPAVAGEFDLLRGMTLLAGVNNSGEVSNGLSVRGGSLDQNLILYDYAPVFNPTHLFGVFSVFTPEVVSSIDLYRANIPARYGGRTSSVMDIKVKMPYVDKFKLKGGIGLVSSRLSVETPIVKDKLMLIFGGRAGFTDFLLPLFSERLNNTKTQFYDTTLKLLYLPTDKDQVTLTGFYSKDFYQIDLISQVQNINAESNQYDFKTLNGTINWLHTLNSNTNIRTVLVGSNYTPKNIFPEVANENEIEFESSLKYFSLISEFSKKVSDKVDYYAGIQANRYAINPGALNPGTSSSVLPVLLQTETSYELSAYTNFNCKPIDNITISAGLRYNHYFFQGPFTLNTYDDLSDTIVNTEFFEKGEKVNSYDNIEPRLGINIRLNEDTSIKASYANVYQYLQNIYNNTTPLPTSRWKTADPNIKPQNSNSYGLGVYKNINGIEMSLEGYYRDTENNLTYKPGADFFLEEAIEQFVVQGEGKAYGIEFALKKSIGKVNGWFNYSWSRSLLRTENQNLLDRINNNQWFNSDFDRPHVVNATVNFEGDPWNTFSFNFTGQTGRPYTIANGVFEVEALEVPIFLERNNARLPTYHRLDFSWNVHFSKSKEKKRWQNDWTFTVYNVYGRKNPFSRFYTARDGRNNDVFSDNPLGSYELYISNSPIVTLTYNFTFQ